MEEISFQSALGFINRDSGFEWSYYTINNIIIIIIIIIITLAVNCVQHLLKYVHTNMEVQIKLSYELWQNYYWRSPSVQSTNFPRCNGMERLYENV